MVIFVGVFLFCVLLVVCGGLGIVPIPAVAIMIFLAVWLVSGLAGSMVAERKEAGGDGFAFGLLFGPLGVIAAGFLDSRAECPVCHERLYRGAKLHCGVELHWLKGIPFTTDQVEAMKKHIEPPKFDERGKPLQ